MARAPIGPRRFLASIRAGSIAGQTRQLVYVAACCMALAAMGGTAEAGPSQLDLTISSPRDVEVRRASVRALVWPGGYPADRRFDEVSPPYVGAYWQGVPNLAEVRRLTIRQAHGFDVNAWHLKPKTGSGRSLIVHLGHQVGPEQDPYWRDVVATRLVGAGVDVVFVTMIAMPPNPNPIFGTQYVRHSVGFLQTSSFHPVALFLEPSIATVNYVRDATGRSEVHMAGLSGGGWTAAVMAALDPRIIRSYPIAGTMPFSSWPIDPYTMDDFEQNAPDLYRLMSYEDAYVMASTGPGRAQVQIFNEFDPCCFSVRSGWPSTLFDYAPAIQQRVSSLGGSWRLVIDRDEREHWISADAVDLVLADLGILPAPSVTPIATATRTSTPTPAPTLLIPTMTPTATSTATTTILPTSAPTFVPGRADDGYPDQTTVRNGRTPIPRGHRS